MNDLPRTCCDPGENIDVSQINFDVFRGFASAGHGFATLVSYFYSFLIANLKTEKMDGYVDHLRLPASSHVGLDLSDPHFWWAGFFIVFNPLFWNVVARLEHKTKLLTRLCFGRAKLACALLACSIILLGLWRDHLFNLACHTQPSWIILRQNRVLILGYISCLVGTVFVVTSFCQLGFYTTFLGDYFGIFSHSSMVNSFPFSVASDPMYLGSFFNFLGLALVKSSPAGVVLSLVVGLVYKAALLFETPFVRSVYEEQQQKRKRKELQREEEEREEVARDKEE